LFELAERFGRTLDELLNGSPLHVPLSSNELTEWIALQQLRNYEAEQEAKRARKK
jgi:hypothetical protein